MPVFHTTSVRPSEHHPSLSASLKIALLATASSSHRRHLALHSDVHARGGQAAISLLLRHHEHPGTALELTLVDRRICHYDRVLGDENLLLSAFVLHGHHAVVRHADDLGDIRVGHLALGLEIPIVMPFACAAHALGKDVHFLRDQCAVTLAHRGRADELAAGDVSNASLEDTHDHEVVSESDAHALPIAVLDGQVLPLEPFDVAADSHGRIRRRLREGVCGYGSDKKSDCETYHPVLQVRP